jgi:uncharacterized protein
MSTGLLSVDILTKPYPAALPYPLQGDMISFMSKTAKHASHPDIVLRLKRAEGHLRSTIAMIETGRNCVEIAQQLHAIEKAIVNAKKALIHDHVDHCLDAQSGADGESAKAALVEFKEISKYL